MRISDWSSDVCSSDLLAIDDDEGEQEQEPGRARRKRLVQLVANISLPLVRARLAVHPDSDGEEHGRSEDRAESFGQLTARAPAPDQRGVRRPGGRNFSRSAKRRVGKGWYSQSRSRCTLTPKKTK